MPERATEGWTWFEAAAIAADEPDELARCAASCLQTPQGRRLLRHLERAFLDRRVAPGASSAELRHVEGQRSVVSHLLGLVARGRQEPIGRESPESPTGVSR